MRKTQYPETLTDRIMNKPGSTSRFPAGRLVEPNIAISAVPISEAVRVWIDVFMFPF